jgi:hypothetical protein
VNPVIFWKSKFSDDSNTNVDTSDSEQRENSDDEDNANDNTGVQNDTLTRVGAERCFPFSGKPHVSIDKRTK